MTLFTSLRQCFRRTIRRREGPTIVVAALGAAHSLYWFVSVRGAGSPGHDFSVYYRAMLEAQRGVNPYLPVEEVAANAFLYHPFSLSFVGVFSWAASLLWWLPLSNRGTTYLLWSGASLLAWVASVVLALRLADHFGLAGRLADVPSSLVVAGGLAFAPIWELFHQGQINMFALLAILGSVYLAEHGRRGAAGLALAVAIVLKTSPVLLLGYYVGVRDWRTSAATLGGVGVLTLGAAIQFSPAIVSTYPAVLLELSSAADPYPGNHGMIGVVLVLAEAMSIAVPPTVVTTVHKVVIAGVGGALVGTALRRPADTVSERGWLLAAVLTVMVVAAPKVWYHHNVFLLFPVLLLLGASSWLWTSGAVAVSAIQLQRLFEHGLMVLGWPRVGLLAFLAHGLLVATLVLRYLLDPTRRTSVHSR